MFELITGRSPYFWVPMHVMVQKRLDEQVAGEPSNTYDEAIRLRQFKPALAADRDTGA